MILIYYNIGSTNMKTYLNNIPYHANISDQNWHQRYFKYSKVQRQNGVHKRHA